MSREDYPYIADENTFCKYISSNTIVRKMTFLLSNDVKGDFLFKGSPLVAYVQASTPFFLYKGGIFDEICGSQYNHQVTVVGYDQQNGTDYWIIRNSWGASWGEQGYMRIKDANKGGKCRLGLGDNIYPY
jgi:C1A family cysteine protease